MPEPVAQPSTLSAKLELADGTRLVGDLSALPDGDLQLDGGLAIGLLG